MTNEMTKAIKQFDYSPDLRIKFNQIEKCTGLKVLSYKYYGPEDFVIELADHLEDQSVQPQDWIDSCLQDIFCQADIVEFDGCTAVIDLKEDHNLDENYITDCLEDANEQNMSDYKFKINEFSGETLILSLSK